MNQSAAPAPTPSNDEQPRQSDTASGSGQSGRERGSRNSHSKATATKPGAAGAGGTAGTTGSNHGSRNSYPQPTAPKPGAAIENISDAGGPRQGTNMNLPAPGTMQKDIPLESSQANRDEKFAIGRLDTDHDSDDGAAAARKRASQFNPTRPSDPLRKPGREL